MIAPDLDLSVEELLARHAAGRTECGLATDAPFAWDRGIGLDELEELIDAAIYRRHWSIARRNLSREGFLSAAGGIRNQAEPRSANVGQPGAPVAGAEGVRR